jgi:uncharacterized protein (DUF169 family)
MGDWGNLERRLTGMLHLSRRPVAVALLDHEPAGIPKFTGSAPSGCSFWRLAAGGRTFFTVQADHYNCPVGSYTHNIQLPPDRGKELDETLGMMFEAGYLRPEEVPGIARLPVAPRAIVYAPLGETPVDASVVLTIGTPKTAMLLTEAAARAGRGPSRPLLGRPTCMAIPVALTGGIAGSLGCIGNRVYTDLGDDEMVVAVAGRDLTPVVEALETIVSANLRQAEYARQRRQQLASA